MSNIQRSNYVRDINGVMVSMENPQTHSTYDVRSSHRQTPTIYQPAGSENPFPINAHPSMSNEYRIPYDTQWYHNGMMQDRSDDMSSNQMSIRNLSSKQSSDVSITRDAHHHYLSLGEQVPRTYPASSYGVRLPDSNAASDRNYGAPVVGNRRSRDDASYDFRNPDDAHAVSFKRPTPLVSALPIPIKEASLTPLSSISGSCCVFITCFPFRLPEQPVLDLKNQFPKSDGGRSRLGATSAATTYSQHTVTPLPITPYIVFQMLRHIKLPIRIVVLPPTVEDKSVNCGDRMKIMGMRDGKFPQSGMSLETLVFFDISYKAIVEFQDVASAQIVIDEMNNTTVELWEKRQSSTGAKDKMHGSYVSAMYQVFTRPSKNGSTSNSGLDVPLNTPSAMTLRTKLPSLWLPPLPQADIDEQEVGNNNAARGAYSIDKTQISPSKKHQRKPHSNYYPKSDGPVASVSELLGTPFDRILVIPSPDSSASNNVPRVGMMGASSKDDETVKIVVGVSGKHGYRIIPKLLPSKVCSITSDKAALCPIDNRNNLQRQISAPKSNNSKNSYQSQQQPHQVVHGHPHLGHQQEQLLQRGPYVNINNSHTVPYRHEELRDREGHLSTGHTQEKEKSHISTMSTEIPVHRLLMEQHESVPVRVKEEPLCDATGIYNGQYVPHANLANHIQQRNWISSSTIPPNEFGTVDNWQSISEARPSSESKRDSVRIPSDYPQQHQETGNPSIHSRGHQQKQFHKQVVAAPKPFVSRRTHNRYSSSRSVSPHHQDQHHSLEQQYPYNTGISDSGAHHYEATIRDAEPHAQIPTNYPPMRVYAEVSTTTSWIRFYDTKILRPYYCLIRVKSSRRRAQDGGMIESEREVLETVWEKPDGYESLGER
eukprot:Tbor_TRINITY_DN4621_c0_g1::TRINITY_DN4621_c0_g1_i1::g.14882::m.14882